MTLSEASVAKTLVLKKLAAIVYRLLQELVALNESVLTVTKGAGLICLLCWRF